LVGVEAGLALRLERQARVGLDLLLHRVEAAVWARLKDQRREAEATECLQHLLGVAPDLGVEAGATGVEHADHRPVARGEAQRLADARAPGSPVRSSARDDLGVPGWNILPSTSLTCGRSTSPFGVTPRMTTFDALFEPRFGRLMRTTGSFEMSFRPSAPIAMSGRLSTIARLNAVDAALHLRLRAAADHHDVVVLPRRDQRVLEPAASISTVANT
jgi:hypothetical protein